MALKSSTSTTAQRQLKLAVPSSSFFSSRAAFPHLLLASKLTENLHSGIQPRTLEVLRNIGAVPYEEGKAGLAKRMINQGVRYAALFLLSFLPS
jgi:hypothetical protein